jgi:hypothetical protein
MGQRFNELSEKHIQFITEQKIFFVGTATADSRVNISPKGMDSLRVLGNTRVAWLNVTGSGNETSAQNCDAHGKSVLVGSGAWWATARGRTHRERKRRAGAHRSPPCLGKMRIAGQAEAWWPCCTQQC